jgi:hypothetical protein
MSPLAPSFAQAVELLCGPPYRLTQVWLAAETGAVGDGGEPTSGAALCAGVGEESFEHVEKKAEVHGDAPAEQHDLCQRCVCTREFILAFSRYQVKTKNEEEQQKSKESHGTVEETVVWARRQVKERKKGGDSLKDCCPALQHAKSSPSIHIYIYIRIHTYIYAHSNKKAVRQHPHPG